MSRRQSVPSNFFYRAADPLPPEWPEPTTGDAYFNTTYGVVRLYFNGKWRTATFPVEPPEGGEPPEWEGPGGEWLAVIDARYVNAVGDTMEGNLDIAGDAQMGVFMGDSTGRKWGLFKEVDGSLVLGCYDDTGQWLGTVLLGNRVTRLLTVTGPPSDPLGIVNKQYCDDNGVSAHQELLGTDIVNCHPQGAITGLVDRLNTIETTRAKVTVGTYAPSDPKTGDIWVNTS